jgi:flavin-dependent dehydrogenase
MRTRAADVDVLIAGAGPAGCAAAISLAQFAPELRVCLVDGGSVDAVHVGETVPPAIRPMLEHLGLEARFDADRHCASYRTLSAWGGARLVSNEFLFHTRQVGWRLDRARFDAMMLEAAAALGARHIRDKVVGLALVDGGWRASLRGGAPVTARFAIDATGRAAALSRALGLRPVAADRLVGRFVVFADIADDGDGLLVEAVPDGWWYTAAIPGDRRIVAHMSDGDLTRTLGRGDLAAFTAALDRTGHVCRTVAHARPLGPPQLQPAGSRHVAGDPSRPMIGIGDAASCFDPISGQGIVKALRSGVFASYAVADALCRGDERGLARYRSFATREFAEYRQTLAEFYALEPRWADQPFWRRRCRDGGRPPALAPVPPGRRDAMPPIYQGAII